MSHVSWIAHRTDQQRSAIPREMHLHLDYKKGQEYLDGYWDRSSPEALRKYYRGFKFNTIKRRPMFIEELKDLEIVYKGTLVQLHKQVEGCLPSLLHYMEEFLSLHKQNEAIREKLDGLLAKTGRESQEENGVNDDDC